MDFNIKQSQNANNVYWTYKTDLNLDVNSSLDAGIYMY